MEANARYTSYEITLTKAQKKNLIHLAPWEKALGRRRRTCQYPKCTTTVGTTKPGDSCASACSKRVVCIGTSAFLEPIVAGLEAVKAKYTLLPDAAERFPYLRIPK